MRFAAMVQVVLLAVVAAMGLLGTFAVVADWLQGLETWSWEEASCTIEASQAVARPEYGDFDLRLSYRYDFRGREYHGDALSHDYQGLEERSAAEVLASRYPAGSTVRCWVDPGAPARSYLRRANLWQGFWVLAPLVMVVVGAGGLWLRSAMREQPQQETRPRSEPTAGAGASLGKAVLVVFFGIFFLFGTGLLVPFFVRPALQVLEARSWRPVPCEILASNVRAHSGDDGDTYDVDVLYRFEIDGHEYRGNRYRFLGGSTSGYERKARIVERLAVGSQTTCWVDPDDPWRSVVERRLTGDALLGLVPLLFTLIGLGGLVLTLATVRGARSEAARPGWEAPGASAASARTGWSDPGTTAGPMVLEPLRTPLSKLGCSVALALSWNGFIAIFVWHIAGEWLAGNPQWGPALILTPFVLIGLLLLSGIPYSILALLNPRPRLHLTPGVLTVGSTAQLDWAFRGLAGRLRGLRIWLEATETETRDTGSGFSIETRPLDTEPIEVLERGRELPLDYGAVSFTIPAATPPTSEGDVAVRWQLKLHGDIGYWPDVQASYEVRLLAAER